MLRVDLKNAGMSAAALKRFGPRLRKALRALDRSEEAGFLRILGRTRERRELSRFVRSAPGGWTDVVQLGIGGSSLGAQTLCEALLPPLHNQRVGPDGPRFHFPDNVDPESFGALLETLDPARTLVHVVSKSGGTLETAAQLHALLDAFRRRSPAQTRLVVTTGEKGVLRDWAERRDVPTLTFPEDIGGRFSVFTASGLLVPALCGVPVARIVRGAGAMLERCRRDPVVGPAGRLAALGYAHDTSHGRPIHVELIYGDALQRLGAWFSQLWAESLGKQGRGPTPVVARGTTDQHSQIQLYMEGPDDKLYTVLLSDRSRTRLRIARDGGPAEIAGRDLGDVFDAEAQGTVSALIDAGRPVIDLRLPRVAPEGVGEILMMQLLQTALAGALYGVSPFGQPGVEAGKIAAMRALKSSAKKRRRGRRPSAP